MNQQNRMLIQYPIQHLKDMTEAAETLGTDSVQYLGEGKWLRVSTKPFKPPLQIEVNFIAFPVSKDEAIRRLGEVKA